MSTMPTIDLWLDRMPSDWRRSRIRNLAALSPNYSSTRPASDEMCTVVPMELLSDDGAIDLSNQQPLEDISTGLPLFEQGDVLFAKITPCMENGKGAFVRQLPTRYHPARPMCRPQISCRVPIFTDGARSNTFDIYRGLSARA